MDLKTHIVPDELLRQPLFDDCAQFTPPAVPLAPAVIESRLRRIRNMPSSGDNTPAAILESLSDISDWLDKLLITSRLQHANSPEAIALRTLDRLKKTLAAGLKKERHQQLIDQAMAQLPAEYRNFMPEGDMSLNERIQNIAFIMLLLKDRMARESSVVAKPYLKRLYKIIDASLGFNVTTDVERLKPVLRWIKSTLETGGVKGCVYLDIGCAVPAGAPGVKYAAEVLRASGLCSEIHGVDVVRPSKTFTERMLRERKIFIYQCNLTRKPAPRKYDVALLANVHRHLDRRLQICLLENIAESMNASGRLFINWRFDDKNSPGVCLKLNDGVFKIENQCNCV